MSGIWPGETQCVVNLTFDVDGVSSWLNFDPKIAKRPSVVSMAEYGPSVAAWRILDILDTHDIKATFYFTGHTAERHPKLVKAVASAGHEIGHHGYLHEPPAELTNQEEESILEKVSLILENLTGSLPKGYRAPRFDVSDITMDLLKSHGFVYDTSLMGDDSPYFVDTLHGKLIEIPGYWSLDDGNHFMVSTVPGRTSPMLTPSQLFNIWSSEFDGLYSRGKACTVTMHPQYIGRPGKLLVLEKFISHIKSHPNVSFMRMIDLANMWANSTHNLR